jgi:3-phenylpropionate/cinnamic acid dioxygenase small subunit
MVPEEVVRQVERFLYHEARLLDERRFREWLDLWTEDAHYWMPVRSTRIPKESKAMVIMNPDNYEEEELAKEGELAYFDETKETITLRIQRLETGMAWAEIPPSRTRRIISNIELEGGNKNGEVVAFSNFLVYRNRRETEQDFFVGRREDLLRRADGQWKIARRKVVLDQNILMSKDLSIFF